MSWRTLKDFKARDEKPKRRAPVIPLFGNTKWKELCEEEARWEEKQRKLSQFA